MELVDHIFKRVMLAQIVSICYCATILLQLDLVHSIFFFALFASLLPFDLHSFKSLTSLSTLLNRVDYKAYVTEEQNAESRVECDIEDSNTI